MVKLRYYMPSSPGIHPQEDMARIGLDGYYKAEPHPVFDCWVFYFDELPMVELPNYIDVIQ